MNTQSSLFKEVSIESIRDIFDCALLENVVWEARLLDGGLFNTTYMVEYGSAHKKAVLRLGPINRHLLMGFEENLMEAEIYVYSVCRKIDVPCSNVLAYDTSKQMIDRDFMIVEYIPSVAMVNTELTEEQQNHLDFQIGKQLAKLHQVTSDSFGFVSRIRAGKYFILLNKDTMEIAAIIDGDRAVFGDVDFEFACSWMNNPAIKDGYGIHLQEFLHPNRVKRRQLYRMFFCLLEAYSYVIIYRVRHIIIKKQKF